MIDIGSARLGMTVAERLRRNRKITSTTRKHGQQQRELHVGDRVADRVRERSYRVVDADRRRQLGAEARQQLVDRVDHLDGVGARLALDREHDRALVAVPSRRTLSFSTLSITRPTSSSRTGAPLR